MPNVSPFTLWTIRVLLDEEPPVDLIDFMLIWLKKTESLYCGIIILIVHIGHAVCVRKGEDTFGCFAPRNDVVSVDRVQVFNLLH